VFTRGALAVFFTHGHWFDFHDRTKGGNGSADIFVHAREMLAQRPLVAHAVVSFSVSQSMPIGINVANVQGAKL
jgi:cold shock CspA family protein